MSGLKLTIAAASIYTNPCKWVRTITITPTPTTTTTTKATVSLTRRLLPSFNNCKGRRITSCTPFTPAAHVSLPSCINDTNNKDLGFRFSGHKCFSSSSQDKGGLSGSSGTGLVADMGQENDDKADHDDWYHDDRVLRQNQPLLQSPSPSQQQHQSSKFLTLPTVLTLGRVAAVPLLVATFYIDSWWGRTATTSIFIAAAITDWLDGYIARKMRLGSVFGAFLDPVADKLMVAATLVLLCTRPLEVAMFGQVPWLLTVPSIAIIGREITMSAVREWAASQNSKLLEAVAVNNLGKWKTATQMTALTIILATRDSSLGGPGLLVASGVVLLYISAGLSLWSLAVYMRKILKVLLK